MDEKDSKPPDKTRRRAGRLNKGEGDIRARQRSFMKQRRAVLLPRGEEALAQPADEDASAHDPEHQEQIAQYRRRQRKSTDAPDAPAGEEQTDEQD